MKSIILTAAAIAAFGITAQAQVEAPAEAPAMEETETIMDRADNPALDERDIDVDADADTYEVTEEGGEAIDAVEGATEEAYDESADAVEGAVEETDDTWESVEEGTEDLMEDAGDDIEPATDEVDGEIIEEDVYEEPNR